MRYISFIFICITILAGAEVATIVTSISPSTASVLQLWLFFGATWVLLTGCATGVWHIVKQQVIYRVKAVSIWVSLRQASLWMALLVLAFFFNTLHILTIWDILPLTISTILIEFFFQAETNLANSSSHGSTFKR